MADFRVRDALSRHKLLWFLAGLAHVKRRYQHLYMSYSFIFHITTFILQMQIFFCLRDSKTILDANEILTPGVILTLLDIKCYMFVRNREKAKEVFRIMEEMEVHSADAPEERILITRAIQDSNRLTATMWISCEAVIVTRFLVSILSAKRELMFPAVLPNAWETDDQSYAIYNCGQFVLTVLGSCGLSTLDTYGPTMYLLLNSFVEILSKRLERLGRTKNAVIGDLRVVDEREERKRIAELVHCIQMHQKCLKIGAYVNDIFGIHYLCQFGASCIGMCTIVFVITQVKNLDQLIDQAHLIICVMMLALQIFIPCFYSNRLNVKSHELLESLYTCDWPEQTRKFKQSLIIFMLRAHKPFRFTTYKGVFEIKLATFVSVCKFAYSMLSCLT